VGRSTCRSLLTLAGVLIFAASARVAEAVPVVLRVTVNTVDQGDCFLELTDAGDVLITSEQLWRLGLHLAEARDSSQTRISLRSLAPRLRFELDESAATLRLTVDPEILPRQEPDLAISPRPRLLPASDDVAFLNYQASHRVSGASGAHAWSFPLETGVRVGEWLGLSTFNANSGPQGHDFTRLNSTLLLDESKHVRRIEVGDILAYSGRLGGSRSLGGIRIASNFALDRSIAVTPRHEIDGVLETPSDVEVYVNRVLVRRDHLAPGPFRYSSLPIPMGLGEVSLVIRDAFGRERTVAVPFYEAPELLMPGLSNYSWSLGFERRGLGIRSFDYGEPMLLGTHRIGLTRATTIGIGIESDRSTQVLSPSIVWGVGSLVAIQAVLATSRDQGTNGAGGAVNVLRNGGRLSADLSAEGYSRHYVTLSSRRGLDRLRLGWSLGFGVEAKSMGSLSLRLSRAETYDRPPQEKASLSWTRGLRHDLLLVAGCEANRDPRRVVGAFAQLNLQLGSLRSALVGLGREEESERATITLQQGTPLGTGMGYELQTNVAESPTGGQVTAGMASTTLQGEHGRYSAHLWTGTGSNNWDASIAGSLALVDHGLFLSRPISDGFALVRVGSIPGVPVLVQNQKIGTTSHSGRLLIPEVVSNSETRITLDPRRIPIDWGLTEVERFIDIPYRGGGVVDFSPTRLQSFEGRIFLARDGTSGPAEYAGIEIEIPGGLVQSVVGKGGLFYFENLPEGSWPARIFLDRVECRFVLRIPRSDKMTVDLGEIHCEAGK
jgi:outer membrane usher protein